MCWRRPTIQITYKTIYKFICSVFEFWIHTQRMWDLRDSRWTIFTCSTTTTTTEKDQVNKQNTKINEHIAGRAELKLNDAELRYDIYMGDVYANRFHVPNNAFLLVFIVISFFLLLIFFTHSFIQCFLLLLMCWQSTSQSTISPPNFYLAVRLLFVFHMSTF